MSFDFSSFEQGVVNFFVETEQKVEAIVVQVKQDVAVVETDLVNAVAWVANNAPAIASNLEAAVAIIEEIGVAANPGVAAAIQAANVAVAGLNAFAAAAKNPTQTGALAQAVVDGYAAYQAAQGAVAQAKSAAVSAPTPAAAAALAASTA